MTQDLFAAAEAREARDRALAQVAENSGSFIERALAAMSGFASDTRWTGEAIRETLTARGIVPHHHNAWGAVVRTAIAHGILEGTGNFENMKGKKSHARMTQVYRRR